jgi:hypothetical protein
MGRYRSRKPTVQGLRLLAEEVDPPPHRGHLDVGAGVGGDAGEEDVEVLGVDHLVAVVVGVPRVDAPSRGRLGERAAVDVAERHEVDGVKATQDRDVRAVRPSSRAVDPDPEPVRFPRGRGRQHASPRGVRRGLPV